MIHRARKGGKGERSVVAFCTSVFAPKIEKILSMEQKSHILRRNDGAKWCKNNRETSLKSVR